MAKTIQQTVRFAAPPQRVFDLYADAGTHTAATGQPAKFTAKAGAPFSAFGGGLSGKFLMVERPLRIVQTWRSAGWKAVTPDSVLLLHFDKDGVGTRLRLAHVNVPDDDVKGVTAGWRDFYWKSWRRHLAGKK